MNNPDATPSKLVALHEAGHAVIARHFELPVRTIQIEAEFRELAGVWFYAGKCEWGFRDNDLTQDHLRDRLAVVVGGLAGECAIDQGVTIATLRQRSKERVGDLDYPTAQEILYALGLANQEKKRRRVLAQEFTRAKRIIAARWTTTVAIAEALLNAFSKFDGLQPHQASRAEITLGEADLAAAVKGTWQDDVRV